MLTFERIFQDFVIDFGGELLPEIPNSHTADYLFPRHNIIAELKSLTVDQTKSMNEKLAPLVLEWTRKTGRLPTGLAKGDEYIVEIKDMPPEIQAVWLKCLKTSTDAGEQTTVRRVYLRLLAHADEHMGQMIAYLRFNGIAPPWPDWRPDRRT